MTNSAQDDDPPPLPGAAVPLLPATGKQRALFALVIILGLLILVALAVLVTGFITGAAGKGGASTAAGWESALDVPAGTRVAGVQLDGARALVHLTAADGEEIVVVDASTGKVLGRLRIRPRP
jgi:hypothetical protein